MKRNHVITIITTMLFLFSCSEEQKVGGEITPDDAKSEINMLANQAVEDVTKLTESDGVHGAMDLLRLLEEYDFNARKSEAEGVKERLQLISRYFIYGPSSSVGQDDDSFSFDDIKGLYEWNPETEEFDKSTSDFFIVLFPTEDSEINNGELKISKLELVSFIDQYDGYTDEYQLPSLIDAYLKIDDVEVISLDFVVDWSADGLPEKADVTLLVSPFTFILGFDQTFETTSSLLTSVSLDGEVIIGMDLDVEFETEAKEEPSAIEGFVQYYNLKISGNVTVPSFEQEENGDINDYVNLELLLDDEKIGDIVFEEDLAYVVYLDGSKELLEDIIQPIVDSIEDFFEEMD